MDRRMELYLHNTYNHFIPTPHARSRRESFLNDGAAPQPSTSTCMNGDHIHGDQQHEKQQQRMAADQAYRAAFASHERAVFQEEARARARRRDAARNRALFRGRLWKRPEFYALLFGFLGLVYPIINEYLVHPWLEANVSGKEE
ncbi:uncharacterized protein F4822DRAFT_434595 [Hypoxylon trugodes]|uniref:uncharacterized protein n=1 Tax=Hypoxylon trugodes TaxID=326681 RepID=UPI0021936089|nr:uncharacterized protein F4822DRAFT_434595 [Hypoxylon trugodes]KAI1383479.1 hypothetical protein F4822DRAFT_434595 [Hypoxylon trugodes]